MALLKNFSKHFGLKFKKTMLSRVSHSYDEGELCNPQREAIIKLIKKKKTKIKDYFKIGGHFLY